MNWKERHPGPELLDADDIPFADLAQNLRELNTINTLLGGHAVTLRGMQALLRRHPGRQHWTIAEIGCGGGDNLYALHRMLHKKGIAHSLIGIDMKTECIAYAAQQYDKRMPVQWLCNDYRDTIWPQQPDVVFSSLFCHHFSNAALEEQLRWMNAQAGTGFFINDLHRHPLAWASIRLLTRLFSSSYLVRNDAPLSVQRGFTLAEWRELLRRAGMAGAQVSWQWAFRHLITCIRES